VADLFPGGKNGKKYGMKSSTAATVAENQNDHLQLSAILIAGFLSIGSLWS
jgi:hypothetical protein